MNERKHELLITTSGILIVVLTVWAQLWTSTAQLYNSDESMNTVAYGLCFIYWSIFALLVTIVATLVNKAITPLSKAFFSIAIVFTFIEVFFMSLLPMIIKTVSGTANVKTTFWAPLWNLNLPSWVDILLMSVVPILALVVAYFTFSCKEKKVKGEIL